MPGREIIMSRRIKVTAYAGLAVLAMALSVIAGCATEGKVKAVAAQPPAVAKGPSVVELDDGRDGFMIMEVPKADEASYRDFDRAVTMLKGQNYAQAVDLLEEVIGRSPGVTAPYIDIAIAYEHIGKPERAEEHLRTALNLFPDHPVVCNELGMLYRKTGRFSEARAVYEQALTRFPHYYPAQRNLGILCDIYLNDLTCALTHYEIYSEAKPEDKQVKLWIADLRSRLGHN